MKKLFKLLLAILLLLTTQIKVFADTDTEAKVTISGFIKDVSNGEALIGATVLVKEEGKGTAANIYGFYSISLKPGNLHSCLFICRL